MFRDFWLLEDAGATRAPSVVAATASVLEELELVAARDVCDITTEGVRRFAPRPGVAYVPIEGIAGSELAVGWKDGGSPLASAFVEAALAVREREVELVACITGNDR